MPHLTGVMGAAFLGSCMTAFGIRVSVSYLTKTYLALPQGTHRKRVHIGTILNQRHAKRKLRSIEMCILTMKHYQLSYYFDQRQRNTASHSPGIHSTRGISGEW